MLIRSRVKWFRLMPTVPTAKLKEAILCFNRFAVARHDEDWSTLALLIIIQPNDCKLRPHKQIRKEVFHIFRQLSNVTPRRYPATILIIVLY